MIVQNIYEENLFDMCYDIYMGKVEDIYGNTPDIPEYEYGFTWDKEAFRKNCYQDREFMEELLEKYPCYHRMWCNGHVKEDVGELEDISGDLIHIRSVETNDFHFEHVFDESGRRVWKFLGFGTAKAGAERLECLIATRYIAYVYPSTTKLEGEYSLQIEYDGTKSDLVQKMRQEIESLNTEEDFRYYVGSRFEGLKRYKMETSKELISEIEKVHSVFRQAVSCMENSLKDKSSGLPEISEEDLQHALYEIYKEEWLQRISVAERLAIRREYEVGKLGGWNEEETFEEYLFNNNGYQGKLYASFEDFLRTDYRDRHYVLRLFRLGLFEDEDTGFMVEAYDYYQKQYRPNYCA